MTIEVNMDKELKISLKTILLAGLIFIGVWLLIQIREVIVLLFVAFLVMTTLKPAVVWMEKNKIPRILGIALLYIVIIGIFAGMGSLFIPPLITESTILVNSLPAYIAHLSPVLNINPVDLAQNIAPISQNILKVTLAFFGNIVTFFALAVITFYMLLERERLFSFLNNLVGEALARRMLIVITHIESRLGSWVRAQIFLGLIIGSMTYLALIIMGINYALPLALIAGVLELIPTIGPIISAIPTIIITLPSSLGLAAIVAVVYWVIHQLENHIVVPQVMSRAIGVSPLISIIVIMVGGKLAGTVGVVLSIPCYLVVETIIQEMIFKK